MRIATHRRVVRWALVAMIATPACGGEPSLPSLLPPGSTDRPRDNLLHDPELQSIVELQVERDGVGLVPWLDHPRPEVRARAAFALASVQDTTAVPALWTRLNDSAASVRADAAFAIGQTADSTSAPRLLDALGAEADPVVRHRLIEALGKTGGTSSLTTLVSITGPDSPDRDAVALAVGRFGIRDVHSDVAVDWLIGAIQAPSATTRRNATYYFGRVSDPDSWRRVADTVRALAASAPGDDPATMHLALGTGRLGDTASARSVSALVGSAPDWRVRANAARALGLTVPSPTVREFLVAALDDPSRHVAQLAAAALANLQPLDPGALNRVTAWVRQHPDDWQVAAPLIGVLAAADRWTVVDSVLDRYRAAGLSAALTASFGALTTVPSARAFETLAARGEAEGPAGAAAVIALRNRWRARRVEDDPANYYQIFAARLVGLDTGVTTAAALALRDTSFARYGAASLLADAYRTLRLPDHRRAVTTIVTTLGVLGGAEAEATITDATQRPDSAVQRAAEAARQRLRGQPDSSNVGPRPSERAIDWDYLREIGERPRLVLETDKGTIALELVTEEAPLTVQTIVQFADAGRYDGVAFHRVVPNFVIQGGNFGGAGFAIRSEFTRIPYERGVLGMASAGKDTEGSQFFVTHSVQPHLDGGYTAFGWVIDGWNVLDGIYQGDVIVRASVERGG